MLQVTQSIEHLMLLFSFPFNLYELYLETTAKEDKMQFAANNSLLNLCVRR